MEGFVSKVWSKGTVTFSDSNPQLLRQRMTGRLRRLVLRVSEVVEV